MQLILQKKNLKKIKIVINGAGAAAMACAKLFRSKGISKNNIKMLDSKGVICLLYTSPSPRDDGVSRMPSSA